MPSQRIMRVQNLLREEISLIVQRKLKDPRVQAATEPPQPASSSGPGRADARPLMVSITRVEADPDLHNARVYISAYGEAEDQRRALEGLRNAAGYIRSELMHALHLRPMPNLDFRYDESLALASHTLDLLDRIRHEQPGPGNSTPARDRADQEE
jgi:ribosome-binding factor A